MKSESYIPVVEAQSEAPSAAVFSGIRGLGYFLTKELLNHELSVTLISLKQRSLGGALKVPQQDIDSVSNLEQFVGDYVFCLLPSCRSTTIFLDPIINLCRQKQSKLLVVEFNDATGKKLGDHLRASAGDLDYRLIFVSQIYGEFVDPDLPDPFGQLLVTAVSNRQLQLPAETQTFLFPTHYQDVAKGLVSAMFKGSTLGKTYSLSSLEAVSASSLALAMKQALAEAGRLEPSVDYVSAVPWTTPDQKLTAYTQADLGWYPEAELKQGLRKAVKNLVDELGDSDTIETIDLPEPQDLPPAPAVVKPLVTNKINEPDGGVQLKRLATNQGEAQSQVGLPPRPMPSSGRDWNRSATPRRRLITRRGLSTFLVLTVLVFVLTLPITSFVWASSRGIGQLQSALASLEAGETDQAQIEAQSAKETLETTRGLVNLMRPLAFMKPEYPEKYDRLLDAASRIAGMVSLSAQTLDQLDKLYRHLVTGEPEIDVDDTITVAKTNTQELYNQNALLIASLDRVEFDSRLDYFNQLSTLKRNLPETQQVLQTGAQLLEILPEIISTDKTKNILVLIQNSGELRPTGGFIDGVALATIRQGRLVNVEYQDVFSLDKQLQGYVEPPPALKKYLGESSWFLRDSNFWPNFPDSAVQAKWFYEKESPATIDGVIAVNLYTLKALLEATGPVSLSPWNETVSATNLFDKILYLSKASPEPKTAGNSYPALELAKVIGGRLTQAQISLPLLAKSFSRAIAEEQLLFYFGDRDLQAKLEQLNWTGSLKHKPCFVQFASVSCVSETFAVNEANIGINKANLFVDRILTQEVEIDDKGRIVHKLQIDYRNTSTSTTWPGGDYKAYVRLYAPLGSQIAELTLSGTVIGLEESKPSGVGLVEFSFPLLVRAGEASQLRLELKSPNVLNTLSEVSALTINWEKQSGLPPLPFKLTINYPEFLVPEAVNLPTAKTPGQIQFLSQQARDQATAVLFRKSQ